MGSLRCGVVWQTWAWRRSRSTVAVARVLGISSSNPIGDWHMFVWAQMCCELLILPRDVSAGFLRGGSAVC